MNVPNQSDTSPLLSILSPHEPVQRQYPDYQYTLTPLRKVTYFLNVILQTTDHSVVLTLRLGYEFRLETGTASARLENLFILSVRLRKNSPHLFPTNDYDFSSKAILEAKETKSPLFPTLIEILTNSGI